MLYKFDYYLLLNIATCIFFVVSIIRHINKKKKYLTNKNDENLTYLIESDIVFTISTLLLLIILSSVLILFKWYIFLVLIIILYIFILVKFIKKSNKLQSEEEMKINKQSLYIFSSVLCFLLVFLTSFLVFIRISATKVIENWGGGIETNIINVYDFIKNPNDYTKNKIIDKVDDLVDAYNNNVNSDKNVDKEKIKNMADDLLNIITSTDSQIDYNNIKSGIEEIVNPYISSNSGIDKNKILDTINQIIR